MPGMKLKDVESSGPMVEKIENKEKDNGRKGLDGYISFWQKWIGCGIFGKKNDGDMRNKNEDLYDEESGVDGAMKINQNYEISK